MIMNAVKCTSTVPGDIACVTYNLVNPFRAINYDTTLTGVTKAFTQGALIQHYENEKLPRH